MSRVPAVRPPGGFSLVEASSTEPDAPISGWPRRALSTTHRSLEGDCAAFRAAAAVRSGTTRDVTHTHWLDLKRSPTNVPSSWRIASIALHAALILSHHANRREGILVNGCASANRSPGMGIRTPWRQNENILRPPPHAFFSVPQPSQKSQSYLESHCLFLSRLSPSRVAELEYRDAIPRRSVLHRTYCPGPLRASRAAAPTYVGRKECLQCATTV
jgi:hypothetical protein